MRGRWSGARSKSLSFFSDIFETAKVSAGLPVSPNANAIRTLRIMLVEGRHLIRQRNAIEERAVELPAGGPDRQKAAYHSRLDQIRRSLSHLLRGGEPERKGFSLKGP